MTSNITLAAQIRRTALELNPALLARKLDEYTRGGTTSASADGRKGAETPLPHLDHTDTSVEAAAGNYRDALIRARHALEQAHTIQQRWTIPAPPLEPEPGECANITCPRTEPFDPTKPDDRLRTGPASKLKLCPACYRHEYRTGQRSDRQTEPA